MFDLLKLRRRHGRPVVRDIRGAAVAEPFRGFPELRSVRCPKDCASCREACPTGALKARPFRLDLGSCIFCGACAKACPEGAVVFTTRHRLGASSRDSLILKAGATAEAFAAAAVESRREIRRLFGRSLKLRQVSAAGCNGCELELNACGNVNFDLGRFGIDFVASPRHADGLMVTGPVSKAMAPALRDAFRSVGEPKVVIAAGACAISGGLFAASPETDRSFFDDVPVDLYIPGCPPHPLTVIQALLDFLGR